MGSSENVPDVDLTRMPLFGHSPEDDFTSMPLFTQSAEGLDSSMGMDAIQALIAEEDPNDLALNLKESGNDAYGMGRERWADAVVYYSNALDAKPTDKLLIAQIYSNRAQVLLRLGNYRSAINDCEEALKRDDTNPKTYYRAALACVELRRHKEAMEWCLGGFRQCPAEKVTDLKKLFDKSKAKLRDEKIAQKARRTRRIADRERFLAVQAACERRGVKLALEGKNDDDEDEGGLYAGDSLLQSSQPFLDDDERLHWPVLLLYPEHHTTDSIQDWHEGVVIGDMLRHILAERPDWDANANYDFDRIGVFFRRGETSEDLIPVDLNLSLEQLLKHEHFVVYQNTPALIIAARATEYWRTSIEPFLHK